MTVAVLVMALGVGCPKPTLGANALEQLATRSAQNVKASRLQEGLPGIALKTWLRRELGPDVRISWEASDCGVTGEGGPGRCDWPLCTEIRATFPSGVLVNIQLIIGSQVEGAIGSPTLQSYEVLDRLGKAVRVYSLRSVPTIAREVDANKGMAPPPPSDEWLRTGKPPSKK